MLGPLSSEATREIDKTVNAATLCATVMIAQHIGGKATRDAVFLSSFEVTSLPPMIIGAAFLSIAVALIMGRLIRRYGPGRIAPAGFLASAGLWMVEWGAYQVDPGIAAVLIFLHMAAVAAILVSSFWSLASERFDPHTAKKKMARIALGANLGGLLGGLTAERVAATLGVDMMLPIMAGMHLFCAWRVRVLRLPDHATADPPKAKDDPETASGLQVLASMPYLRNLALLLLIGTVATGLIDYVFKSQAAAMFSNGDELGRFFAIFYTVLSAATLLVQAVATNRVMARFGLAKTIAAAPAAVVALGVGFMALPGMILASLLVGLDNVIRNSMFRSAYEVLFTPVPRDDKRATKTIIDVGFDRVGDAVGGALVAVMLLAGPETAGYLLVGSAVVLAGIATVLSFGLHRGYVETLEQSLLTRAHDLELDDIKDSTTRMTLLQTMGTLDVSALLPALAEAKAAASATSGDDEASGTAESVEPSVAAPIPAAPARQADPGLRQLEDLRSGDAARVQVALGQSLNTAAVPDAIRLLAWDAVHKLVAKSLRDVAPRITGQLADVLLDPDVDFGVRRRVPRLLAFAQPQRAWFALMQALGDRRFEVRFQTGRALLQMHRRELGVAVDAAVLEAIILKELAVNRRVWDGRRVLDATHGEESPLLDGALSARTNKSLEHVFTLISLTLPSQAVKVAFRGLQTDDALLRGTALEYLETTLSESVRVAIWPFIADDDHKPAVDKAKAGASLERLLKSQQSIELNLSDLRAQLKEDSIL